MNLKLISFIIAIVLAVFAAFSFSPFGGLNLGWLSLAFIALGLAV